MSGLLLEGVTIVNTRDGGLARDMAILMDGGKITNITAVTNLPDSNSAQRVKAQGKFVVPGYLDLHAHVLNSGDSEGSLALLLANGITGFRQLSGTPADLQARREGTLMPPPPAPELLDMPGEVLTPMLVPTPEAAVAEVRKQASQGADFIKLGDAPPPAFFAALDESKRQDLRFIGHLPPAVDVREAASKGMCSIEHLGPRDALLLACSSEEAAIRKAMASVPPRIPSLGGDIPLSIILRMLANPTLLTEPAEFARYRRVIDTFDEGRCDELAGHLAASGTWQVPTLIRVRTMYLGDAPEYRQNPNLRYVPRHIAAMWQELGQQFETRMPAEVKATLKDLFRHQQRLVKPFKRAGVKMMAGSDLGGG
ncbi:MAG: hypothetical protein JOZ39_03180, partial [Chloroflexi bacterium]|nr:hypothetical protein [Chloroflexota bacterium]